MISPIVFKNGAWVTTEPSEVPVNGSLLTVPAGFVFDLASIPHVLRSLIDKEDLGVAGPLVHDQVYQTRGRVEPFTVPPIRVTRRAADRLLRDLCREDGVGFWKRWAAWLMVRLFGFFPWPPAKTTVRVATRRALNTVWQAAVATAVVAAVGWPLLLVAPIAGGLAFVKSLVVVPITERIEGVLYR